MTRVIFCVNRCLSKKYLKHNLKQSIGFCACEMLRRVIGMAHVPELDAIIDNTARDIVERYCIEVAEKNAPFTE